MNKKLAKLDSKELLNLYEDFVRANHHDPDGEIKNSLPDFSFQQIDNEIRTRLGIDIDEESLFDEDDDVAELDLSEESFAEAFNDDYSDDDWD